VQRCEPLPFHLGTRPRMPRRGAGSPTPMRLRRQTRKRRVIDAIGTYLKFKTIAKLAKRAPTPVKALPVVAGVGAASALAKRKRRSSEPTAA
jgi:hypothetical protein